MQAADNMDVQQHIIAKRHRENFPVASLLIPPAARRQTVAFYRFARGADDIADSPKLSPQDKVRQLDSIKEALQNDDAQSLPTWAREYNALVKEGTLSPKYGFDLLSAFRQDALKNRYESWEELVDYCMRSAAPVGRAVLELNDEDGAEVAASDALCNVLQILNHLQDMREDYLMRDRVYFPTSWITHIEDLGGRQSSENLREVKHRALGYIEEMLYEAQGLLPTIRSWRVRTEITFIWYIADQLAAKLRKKDPLKTKVKLSPLEYGSCFVKALMGKNARQKDPQDYVNTQARRAKSSFYWPMMVLPGPKRDAMLALYSFFRALDDAVDDASSAEEADTRLGFFEDEIDAVYGGAMPKHPVSQAMAVHIKQFNLPRQYFDEMVEGLRMDLDEKMVKPFEALLDRYCYCVASCVGLLSIEIFGYNNPKTRDFALHLGKGMQLINILRDVREDAEQGRVYLPREALAQFGLDYLGPLELVQELENNKTLRTQLFYVLAGQARHHMEYAFQVLPSEDRPAMLPALLMAEVYRIYFTLMETRHWQLSQAKPRISLKDKLKLMGFAIKHRWA